LCSLGLNADIYFAGSFEESTAPGTRRQSFPTAKSAHKAKTQNNASHFQFVPGAVLPVDLDDEQVRTLSQILSSLTSKAPENPVSMRLKQDASHQKGRLQSLDSQKQNNIRDSHRGPSMRRLLQHADYDGGYTLFTMKVSFQYGDRIEEMFWKCNNNLRHTQGVHSCDAGGKDDYSTFTFQDKIMTALENEFPDNSFQLQAFEPVESKGISEDYEVSFSVTGPLAATGLFQGFSSTDTARDRVGTVSCCGIYVEEELHEEERRRLLQSGRDNTETTGFSCAESSAQCDPAEHHPNLVGYMEFTLDESDLAFTPFVCGDGIVQSTSAIGDTDVEETCDESYEYNHEYSSCHFVNTHKPSESPCRCNPLKGFELVGETCTCKHRPPERSPKPNAFSASESTLLAGANNVITLVTTFNEEVHIGNNYMVVEVVGLTGSQTANAAALPIICLLPWTDCNGNLGVLATRSALVFGDSNTAFDWGKGSWNQKTGTLKFTVAAETLRNSGKGPIQLKLQITLQNSAVAQSAVTPYLRNCGHWTWPEEDGYMGFTEEDYSGMPLLASNKKMFNSGSNCAAGCSLTKMNSAKGSAVVVATVSFTTPPTAPMEVSTPEAIVGRGVSMEMNVNLPLPSMAVPCNKPSSIDTNPTCSTFAGAHKSLLKVEVGGAELTDGVTLNIALDTAVVRTRGGCLTTESKTLTICLPGYVSLYRFNDLTATWEGDAAPTATTSKDAIYNKAVERQDVTSFSTWAALATSPCCDYEGSGTACGDKMCLTANNVQEYGQSVSVALGGGTLSKMPAVGLTDRPVFTSQDAIQASVSFGVEAKTMQLRVGWTQMCPGSMSCGANVVDLSWYPSRFGHVVQAVGASTLIIYGGMGCKKYETVRVNNKNESRCKELMLLDDLWEFNAIKALAGQDPFSQLETSPRLHGMMGMTAAVLPNADNRILMFGGSTIFHTKTLLSQRLPQPVEGMFQVRNLEFRASKATRTDLFLLEMSSNAKVQNSTHVILFGGFIGNSLSSAVVTYEMTAASPALGLSPLAVLSLQSPEARSYPGLFKPDETTLFMYGGFSDGAGRSDAWVLDIVSNSWKQIARQDTTDPDQPYPTAFNAFSSFYLGGQTVFVTSGGTCYVVVA